MQSPSPPPQQRIDAPDASWLRRHHRQNAVSWGVLVLGFCAMLGISFIVSPDAIENETVWLSPTCPSKKFFGVECPTCGMTRGFSSLSHGQWNRALEYNRGSPLFYSLAWVGVAWGGLNAARSLRKARRVERRSTNR